VSIATVERVRTNPVRSLTIGLVAVVLVVLPFVTGATLSAQIAIFCIFALGYNLLFGYAGQLSFGHAAYFGLGAYGTLLAIKLLSVNVYLGVAAGTLVATIAAVIFGRLSLVRRGVYFAMITLAFAQMVYFLVFAFPDLMGGSNGLFITSLNVPFGEADPMNGGLPFYAMVLAVLLVISLALTRLINSPLGSVLIAMRENEERAVHLGYDSDRYLTIAFTISGLLAGLAGALNAALFAFVSPQILFWTISGEIVFITILGGMGTIAGPIVGVLVFRLLSNWLTGVTEHWPVVFGALFILIVLFAPEGLYGLVRERFDTG